MSEKKISDELEEEASNEELENVAGGYATGLLPNPLKDRELKIPKNPDNEDLLTDGKLNVF